MRHLLLQAQAWWDVQRFDQPVWQLAAWRDQKVRHIQLHVAKALGKVVAALDGSEEAASDTDRTARVRDEVLPDVAIYRSQLINTFPDGCVPTALLFRPRVGGAAWSATAPPPGCVPHAEPLFRVVLLLSRASARLAAYLEPREHGVEAPASHIQAAIQDLHNSAEALAAYFTVDLARAHQTRLEALLGAPLPSSLVEREREDL
jgi:hypothetical protein